MDLWVTLEFYAGLQLCLLVSTTSTGVNNNRRINHTSTIKWLQWIWLPNIIRTQRDPIHKACNSLQNNIRFVVLRVLKYNGWWIHCVFVCMNTFISYSREQNRNSTSHARARTHTRTHTLFSLLCIQKQNMRKNREGRSFRLAYTAVPTNQNW